MSLHKNGLSKENNMDFLIQSDDVLDIERDILLEKLNRHKYVHTIKRLKLEDFDELNLNFSGEEIPIGTIDFVTKYMNKVCGFTKQNPIEIPVYLRTDEFLKREYQVVTWDKIPRKGVYFLKDASTLKHFSFCGDLEFFIQEDMFEKPKNWFDTSLRLDKNSKYIVSKAVRILSEYRVYVLDGEISAIAHYDGYPTVFPDAGVITKAVNLINLNEKWLKSYTIDVMVTHEGTSIIEVHNFTSCGLYTTIFGDELLLGYRQGIDYLKNDNKELQV